MHIYLSSLRYGEKRQWKYKLGSRLGESWGVYIPVGHSFLKVHSSANTTRVDDLELEG